MANVTLGGNPSTTSGNLPAIGTQAPDFTLVKSDMSEIKLADFAGKKLILNIFPSVDTGVCAASVRHFNKDVSELDNTAVLCVSADLPFAQARFCGAEGIENVEVASSFRDDAAFGKSYGSLLIDGGFKGLHARAVVVVDANGVVSYTELVPEIGQEPNYEAALAAL
ncbi:MAG: thiol peroxidase [Cyclobacteriaceae bacterium]|jgi:thiol peroxidase